jgi:hypothetical protein
MWVDYVRVYARDLVDSDYTPARNAEPTLSTAGIGLNFAVANEPSTHLKPEITAGHAQVAQRNWNNLLGAQGEEGHLKSDNGESVPAMKVAWSVPEGDQTWRSKKAREWGFQQGNLALQSGHIQLGGSVKISGIPYKKYDLYVYIGAGDQAGAGSVTLSDPHAVNGEKPRSCFYRIGWTDGKFRISDATDAEHSTEGNVVVFKGNTADTVELQWKGELSGGWTGISGVQIVSESQP